MILLMYIAIAVAAFKVVRAIIGMVAAPIREANRKKALRKEADRVVREVVEAKAEAEAKAKKDAKALGETWKDGTEYDAEKATELIDKFTEK